MRNIYSKVNSANRHIDELHRVIKRYIGTSPYRISRKPDSQTGELIYYLVEAPPIPEEMALIAGVSYKTSAARSIISHGRWWRLTEKLPLLEQPAFQ